MTRRQVKIALPAGTRELTLKVDSTPDGPGYDQADWADACIVTTNGTVRWADEDRQPFTATATPFSFRYGGAASATFLKDWPRTVETKETPTRAIQEVSWTDPKTKLRVSASVTTFKRYPAVEWLLEFENLGTQDTPLLSDVQALDVQLRTGYFRKQVILHQLNGDVCGERSFLPFETEVEPGKTLALAPEGGRSSNGAFPFFNVQYGNQGMIAAIGWSGQWRASLERASTGPTTVRAGMEKLALVLHPGEKIRTPRILILPWKGGRLVAHNRFRRLMLFEYAPRLEWPAAAAAHRAAMFRPLRQQAPRLGHGSRPDPRGQGGLQHGLRHALAGRRVVRGRLSQRGWQLVLPAPAFSQRPQAGQ